LRLVIDGIVNAGIEHMEVIMTAKRPFKPVPWPGVLLAVMPGIWVAFSRRHADLLAPALSILGAIYIGVLVLALPIVWWRTRQFPVWALLPAGTLIWFLVYMAGNGKLLDLFGLKWTGIALLNTVLATALFMALLPRQRLGSAVWALVGIMVLGNVLVAIANSMTRYEGAGLMPDFLQFFLVSLVGPAEGLMLVAVGLLAARQHGLLALLVVAGGYGYLFLDSDYLFGSLLRDWTGLSLYLVTVTTLYLVVMPVALLRAKTRPGRACAVSIPVVAFHVARLAIPSLVLHQPLLIWSGDIMISINALLSLVLAWLLYSQLGDASGETLPDNLEVTPLPG
jgi:hypothetical protein